MGSIDFTKIDFEGINKRRREAHLRALEPCTPESIAVLRGNDFTKLETLAKKLNLDPPDFYYRYRSCMYCCLTSLKYRTACGEAKTKIEAKKLAASELLRQLTDLDWEVKAQECYLLWSKYGEDEDW